MPAGRERRDPGPFTVRRWRDELRRDPEEAARRLLGALEEGARNLHVPRDQREDLIQEAALRAFVFARTGRCRDQARTFPRWIQRILRNVCAEEWRRSARERSLPREAKRSLMKTDSPRGGGSLALAAFRIWLDQLASMLPIQQRDLVRMLFLKRMSRKAIVAWLQDQNPSLGRRRAMRLILSTERHVVQCYLGNLEAPRLRRPGSPRARDASQQRRHPPPEQPPVGDQS